MNTQSKPDARPRRWRWLAIALGAVLVLVIGAVAVIATVDLEGFARARLGVVEQATGRTLTVGGKLSVRLFPRIVIVAEDVRFANASWGSQPDMVRVQRVEAVMALLPLLQRRIEVARLELVAPDVLLERDARGTGNWDLQPKGAKAAPPSGSGSAFGITAPSIVVHNGKITLREKGATPLSFAIAEFELSRSTKPGYDAIELTAAWRDQPFSIKGDIGSIERLIAREAKWPFEIALTMPGTEAKFAGELDRSGSSAAVNGKLAAEVRDVVALSKLTGTALNFPTPAKLDATLASAANLQRIEPMSLQLGRTAIAGSASINTAGPKPRISAKLTSKDLDLGRPGGGAAGGQPGAAPSSGKLFSDAKLPFAALQRVDADVDLHIDRLRLPDGIEVANLNARGALTNGHLVAEPVSMNLAQGTLTGRIDILANARPRTALRLDARHVSLPTLMAQLGRASQMSGGATDASADLVVSGDSMQAMAASADGTVRVSIGPTRLPATIPLSEITASIFDAINPDRRSGGGTELHCAVAVLPIKSGVATLDRSIAIETSNYDVIASGTIDLRSEQLDLSLRPVVKRGLGVGTINLAQFVAVRGPLAHPRVGVSEKEVLAGALSIGAAAASGGLSLLGQRLLQQAADPAPCKTAASGKATPATSTPSQPQAAPTNPADLLRGLFGKR